MNHIKAIETTYKGYRFRSRLEARWAVFFDTLGIPWKYENEGYQKEIDTDLGTKTKRYLPDFFLPSRWGKGGMFVEVKGNKDGLKVDWKQGIFYKTVMSDLSDLKDVYYDVLAFFSPTGIKSLFKNFPNFEQNNTRIAVFGPTTQKEALDHGLRVDILAPTPGTPSMTGALEKYVAEANKGK